MKILLIGGGSGGHITPLLAVAHELKKTDPNVELIGVCEKNSRFVNLYQDNKDIDRVFQIRAGKYRRYGGLPWWEKAIDIKTFLLNVRDIFRTLLGYQEAKGLIKHLQPDAALIKGGHVAVPMGKAAAKIGLKYITHDSDSTPGLANKLISESAICNATGMPVELYNYPKDKVVYTGIPLNSNYKKVSPALRASYRDKIGLSSCDRVITLAGGSQGAGRLNEDFSDMLPSLLEKFESLGVAIIAGDKHKDMLLNKLKANLSNEKFKRVVVKGFVSDLYAYSGAADIIITRAGATNTAEFGLQALPLIMVPANLAGSHQHKNADYFAEKKAVLVAETNDKVALSRQLIKLLEDSSLRAELARNLNSLVKPNAAKELADLTLKVAKKQR